MIERQAVAEFGELLQSLPLGIARGVARGGETADLGFQRSETRGALGSGARGAGCVVLGLDQAAFGAAVFLFGFLRDDARGIGGVLGRGVVRERFGAQLLRRGDVGFESGEAVALRQAGCSGRGRIGRRRIAVPAP